MAPPASICGAQSFIYHSVLLLYSLYRGFCAQLVSFIHAQCCLPPACERYHFESKSVFQTPQQRTDSGWTLVCLLPLSFSEFINQFSWLLRNCQCVEKVIYGLLNHSITAVSLGSTNPYDLPHAPSPKKPKTNPTNQQKQRSRNKLRICPAGFYVSFYYSCLCLERIRFVISTGSVSSGFRQYTSRTTLSKAFAYS